MHKRITIILLIFAMVFMTACSTGTKVDTTGTSQGKDTPEGPGIVELTAWVPARTSSGRTSLNWMDSKIGALLAKETGVSLTQNFITGDAEQAFNLKLASRDWEDIISTGLNFTWVDKLVSADAIIPLDNYFEMPDKYPNLAKIPEKVLDNFRYTDGHIYYFPSGWYEDENSVYGYWCAAGWYVHPEYLKAVGMSADELKTLDDVERYLELVKNAELKTQDGLSVVPMTSTGTSLVNVILSTFGVSTSNMGFDLYNGEIIHFRDNPKTREALAWLNKLNRKELLDKEMINQTGEQLQEKLMNRRVALIADWAWNFWTSVTQGVTPTTEMEYINFPLATGVNKPGILMTYNPYGTGGVMVTKNCKNPDAVAKLADWGAKTGAFRGWEAFYGPFGTTWDWDPEKGKPYLRITDEEILEAKKTGDYNKLDALGMSVISIPVPFDLDLNYYSEGTQDTLFWIFGMHRFNATQGYHAIIRPYDQVIMPPEGSWNRNVTTLRDIDTEYFAKLILAKSEAEFEDTWNKYTEQLEKLGKWSEVRAEWEAAYKSQVK